MRPRGFGLSLIRKAMTDVRARGVTKDTPPLCAPWSAPETIVGSEGTVKGSAKNLQTWLLCMVFRLSGKWLRFVRSAPFAVFRLSGIVRVLCVL